MEQSKNGKVPIDYCTIGLNILDEIRKELVIPFLKSSEQTKRCGIVIDERDEPVFEGNHNDDGEMSFFSYTDGGKFPLSKKELGTELKTCIALTRYSIIHDEKMRNRCKAIDEIECYEALVPSAVGDLCEIWIRDCLRYLRALTEHPLRALSMLMEDKHPYTLYSAIMSLNLMYNGSPDLSNSLLLCVGGLIKLYEDTHDEK